MDKSSYSSQVDFDWEDIMTYNPNEIVVNKDIKKMGQIAAKFLSAEFNKKDYQYINNPNVFRLLQLLQIVISFQINSSDQIERLLNESKKKYSHLKDKAMKLQNNVQSLSEKKEKYKTLEKCPTCSLRFKSIEKLDQHVYAVHPSLSNAWKAIRENGIDDNTAERQALYDQINSLKNTIRLQNTSMRPTTWTTLNIKQENSDNAISPPFNKTDNTQKQVTTLPNIEKWSRRIDTIFDQQPLALETEIPNSVMKRTQKFLHKRERELSKTPNQDAIEDIQKRIKEAVERQAYITNENAEAELIKKAYKTTMRNHHYYPADIIADARHALLSQRVKRIVEYDPTKSKNTKPVEKKPAKKKNLSYSSEEDYYSGSYYYDSYSYSTSKSAKTNQSAKSKNNSESSKSKSKSKSLQKNDNKESNSSEAPTIFKGEVPNYGAEFSSLSESLVIHVKEKPKETKPIPKEDSPKGSGKSTPKAKAEGIDFSSSESSKKAPPKQAVDGLEFSSDSEKPKPQKKAVDGLEFSSDSDEPKKKKPSNDLEFSSSDSAEKKKKVVDNDLEFSSSSKKKPKKKVDIEFSSSDDRSSKSPKKNASPSPKRVPPKLMVGRKRPISNTPAPKSPNKPVPKDNQPPKPNSNIKLSEGRQQSTPFFNKKAEEPKPPVIPPKKKPQEKETEPIKKGPKPPVIPKKPASPTKKKESYSESYYSYYSDTIDDILESDHSSNSIKMKEYKEVPKYQVPTVPPPAAPPKKGKVAPGILAALNRGK